MIELVKNLLKKLIGPSVWTSVMGYFALALAFITQGGVLLDSIIAFLDSDPLTVINQVELKEALNFFGLGSVAGILGIKAKDNNVSTEDVKAYNTK